MYYLDKIGALREIFGTPDVVVGDDHVVIAGRRLPVIDDVIVAIDPARLPASARGRVAVEAPSVVRTAFAEDIQYTFGQEWQQFPEILAEHTREFSQYFDIVDLEHHRKSRICDLGCGNGRWATFLAPLCRDLIVVDYSDAIFVARENLREYDQVIFVMADILDLPFAPDAFDFLYCLGVLHHLPVPADEALRRVAPLASEHLIYLYYALDNRPWHFRLLLRLMNGLRLRLAEVRSARLRGALATALTLLFYVPASVLGRLLRPLKVARWLPLAEFYAGSSFTRLRQDAYDRFFTRIEQRFTKADIERFGSGLGEVTVSSGPPYWHFVISRKQRAT